MPNFRVFTDQASDLKTLIYGNDGSTNRVLLTDSSGAVGIYSSTTLDVNVASSTTLTVTATNLDIRDITNASDSILVYGNDGTANRVLLTNSSGAVGIYASTTLDVNVASSTTLTVTATNLDIRDITNASDSILVYGNDGTVNRVLLTNSSGAVGIYASTTLDVNVASSTTLTVTATNLDIRDITSTSDSILIYGNDGATNRIILTDSSGNVQTMIYRRLTTDTNEAGLSTATNYAGSTARDIGEQSQVTFAVKNTGATYSATVKLQLSPNNSDWIDDSAETNVTASNATAIAPSKYLRYARIAYKSQTAGQDTSLTIWYQTQV